MLGAATIAAAMTLLHCASQDDPRVREGSDAGSDANVADTGGDEAADAGASDAANEDEYEIPDGAVVCDGSPCAVAITGGTGTVTAGTVCALMSDKTVQCWGSNQSSKAGFPDDFFVAAPRRVPGLTDIRSVSIGGDNGCAVDEAGKVYCWGEPALVNAGRDPDAGVPFDAPIVPTLMDLVPPAVSVEVMRSGTACVTTKTGTLSCWGNNSSFELAGARTEPVAPPTDIPLGGRTDVITSAGNRWMFAMTKSGELLSWGAYRCTSNGETCSFMLARESSEDFDPIPTVVPGMPNVRSITTGQKHACAVVGRFVQCWGDNSDGQLGRGTIDSISELPGATRLAVVTEADDTDAGLSPRVDVPLQVAVDFRKTCAAMGSGRVYCWGRGDDISDVTGWGTPARVDGFSGPAVAVAGVFFSYCALMRNGAVECWGTNVFGSLGRNFDTIFGPDNEPPMPVVFSNE
jgi:alpha-tubulin suppressor-like RCC1 family protein